jgi:hypothetical protein
MSGILVRYNVECEESKSLERYESWPFETDTDTELNKILKSCSRKKKLPSISIVGIVTFFRRK